MSPRSKTILTDAYRVVWRWHFYAGFLVLPVLMLMALTGGLYLFKPEIEDALYRPLSHVQIRDQRASPDRWVAAAQVGLGGEVSSVLVPERADRAIQVKVRTEAGERTAFVDPYDAHLIGSIKGDGLMGSIMRLHSLELFGRPFNILVEIVAGWSIILVATGLFLWWPRLRDMAVAVPRTGDPRRRPFWRDLHAVTGLYAGGVIAFLAVTGMPWSAVWGDVFLAQMRASGLGRPPAPAAASPWGHSEHHAPAGSSWTMEGAVMHARGHGEARLSTVIATVEAQGMARPYRVSIPGDPTLAYTAAHQPLRAEDARSLYVDGRTGEVKADARWSQFGVGAKAFEWGIAVHQGQQYGWANRLVMLAGCVAVWVLAISGLMMWWKRRPRGRRRSTPASTVGAALGAPYAPPGPRARAAVVGIVLPLAILYPLTGLSLVVAVLLDRLVSLVSKFRSEIAR